MCYVAADPAQPGAAWGLSLDAPEYRKYTAADIARWIKADAEVLRVDLDTGLAMLKKWRR